MKILRHGLAHYPGFTLDNNVWKIPCLGCNNTIQASAQNLTHMEENDIPFIAVTCPRCCCVFKVEEEMSTGEREKEVRDD